MLTSAAGIAAWRVGLVSLAIGGPIALLGLAWLVYEVAQPDTTTPPVK